MVAEKTDLSTTGDFRILTLPQMKPIKQLKALNRDLYPRHLFYPPQWLVLGVNNLCNLHCKMCDVGTQTNDTIFATNLTGTQPMHMPLELFDKIASQTARYFPQTKLGYAFTEPLIYKYLEESLALAQQYQLHTSITTNALKLEQKAEALCELGVKELFISLDGLAATHNEIRGSNQSFERAMAGIEKLLPAKGCPEISIFFVITQWNIGELKAFADFFGDMPITRLGFMHTNFTPASVAVEHNLHYGQKYFATRSNVTDVDVEAMDLEQLWQQIEQVKKTDYNFPVSFSPELTDQQGLNHFYQQPSQFIGKKCHDVFKNMMIKSDGSVIPAHGRCYNLNLGNLYQQDLKQIWNSPANGNFRTDLNKAGGLLPACSRCCSSFA
ncbi:MAG: radical SAM protein with 4Fe4S-binding SPASM domain [Phenylobacterium sp.]